VEQRKHWWNGRFAKPTRRDVYLWQDRGRWHVEAQRGGIGRRSRLFAFDDEAAALTLVEALLGGDVEGWREVGR
jgi:hypothetical protein